MNLDGCCNWTLNLLLSFPAVKEKKGNVVKMSLLIVKESQEFTWHKNWKGIDPKGH